MNFYFNFIVHQVKFSLHFSHIMQFFQYKVVQCNLLNLMNIHELTVNRAGHVEGDIL